MEPTCHTFLWMMIHLVPTMLVLAAGPSLSPAVGVDVVGYGAAAHASGTLVLSPLLRGEVPIGEYWSARLAWGVVYRHELSDSGGYGQVRYGNPAAAFVRHFDWLGATWRVGGGFTLPAARLHDGVLARRRDRNTLAYASGMRGNRELWLWAPERGSLFLPAEAAWRLEHWTLAGELTAALLTPIGDFGGRTDFVVQTTATAAYVTGRFRGGLRAHLVVITTQPRERLQWSAAPFAGVDLGRAHVRAELLVPIGDPLASFDLWALSAGVEVIL